MSTVRCSHPAGAIDTAVFQTFPSLDALYSGYVSAVASLTRVQPIATNFGECSAHSSNGEISWNHNFMHRRTYSLEQLMYGQVDENKAGGRLFCGFANGQFHIVWTMNDGRMLGEVTGGRHQDVFRWWRAIHHSIAVGSSEPQMQGSETHMH